MSRKHFKRAIKNLKKLNRSLAFFPLKNPFKTTFCTGRTLLPINGSCDALHSNPHAMKGSTSLYRDADNIVNKVLKPETGDNWASPTQVHLVVEEVMAVGEAIEILKLSSHNGHGDVATSATFDEIAFSRPDSAWEAPRSSTNCSSLPANFFRRISSRLFRRENKRFASNSVDMKESTLVIKVKKNIDRENEVQVSLHTTTENRIVVLAGVRHLAREPRCGCNSFSRGDQKQHRKEGCASARERGKRVESQKSQVYSLFLKPACFKFRRRAAVLLLPIIKAIVFAQNTKMIV